MKKGIILEIKNNQTIVITKEGEFLSVPSCLTWNVGEEIEFDSTNKELNNNNNNKVKSLFAKKGLIIALAACIMLFIIPFTNIIGASTYITIDINPSIELELKRDKVVNIRGLNNEGEKIVSEIPKDIKNINQVTEQILFQAKEQGYLVPNEDNYIVIGLCDAESKFSIIEYEQFIKAKLTNQNLAAEILVVSGSSTEKNIADNKDVSLGRYIFQQTKKTEGIEISDEQLGKDSIKEIIKEAKEAKPKDIPAKDMDKDNPPKGQSQNKEQNNPNSEGNANKGNSSNNTNSNKPNTTPVNIPDNSNSNNSEKANSNNVNPANPNKGNENNVEPNIPNNNPVNNANNATNKDTYPNIQNNARNIELPNINDKINNFNN